ASRAIVCSASRPSSATLTALSSAPASTEIAATRCATTTRACATSPPTMTATLVAPGPRATTDPSPSTMATRASSVVQMGCAPTSTLPLLSVIVAARCSVSPTASAVSAAGLTPTHAAPMLPMVWCASERPITPYVYNADTSDTTAAPVDATAATVRHAC